MSVAAFVATALAILLTPGPTNTLLAASGAAMGLRNALFLPLAEALGYALAISLFLAAAGMLEGVPAALPALKLVAAAWLCVSAVKLWSQPIVPEMPDGRGAFWRVLVTTMLNPKALLVGTVVIPGLMPDAPVRGVLGFIALSAMAGLGWTMLGALLPAGARRYSYRGAALVLAGFALAAAVSAAQA